MFIFRDYPDFLIHQYKLKNVGSRESEVGRIRVEVQQPGFSPLAPRLVALRPF
jgi:hypothetical protein